MWSALFRNESNGHGPQGELGLDSPAPPQTGTYLGANLPRKDREMKIVKPTTKSTTPVSPNVVRTVIWSLVILLGLAVVFFIKVVSPSI